MVEKGAAPPGQDPQKPGTGGLRTPLQGESSSDTHYRPPSDADTIIGVPLSNFSVHNPTLVSAAGPGFSTDYTASGQPVLTVGYLLGQRYEILSLLGEGGMGAVYKARDVELGRLIALKIIRRELAGNRGILDRFKQELILATQVTHRNVVRIYDLGEAEGLKFITMEFVEGEDLRALIQQRTKLAPREAAEIIDQVCRALEAAHSAGVIHRDLKPQNIMRDSNGRILVMDFGLAKTLEGDGMTQTGALVGTMEYMSPEQALAQSVDPRSDLFSVGLIFYELLTGATPFRADSALASLIKRTQERVSPITEIDSTIPVALSQIVGRCLERDLNLRYQSATEVIADLELWLGTGRSGVLPPRPLSVRAPWLVKNKWWLAGTSALVLLLIVLSLRFLIRSREAATPGAAPQAAAAPARLLAIMPFRNGSNDPKDDWIGSTLADMLGTDIGQSEHLHEVPADRLHQVLTDLRVGPGTNVDPDTLHRIAQFSSADVIVSGQYARFGDQVVIDATIRDLTHDQTFPIKAQALVKDLPAAVDNLADSIRKHLSLSADVVEELKAQSFKPVSKSVEALRDYNEGAALMRSGKNLDALKYLQAATNEDPEFALAFSTLADVQSDLGFESEAEQSSMRAAGLVRTQQLPLPEKYLINASNARILKDNKRAIEAYENLAKSLPGDVDVQYELGNLYLQAGEYEKARTAYGKVLASDPKNIKALWKLGVVENFSGNPQAALDSLTQGLNLAIQVDNQEQRALILLSIGISYRSLNKLDEAQRNYQDSIAINEKIGQKRGVAAALDELADLQQTSGKPEAALASYIKALTLLREIGMKEEMASTLTSMGTLYVDQGQFDKALDVFKQALQIQRDAGDQSYEAQCLNNIGGVYLAMGDGNNAFTYYQQALQVREKLGVPGDLAETLEGLSEAYTSSGQYEQAMTSLMRALELGRKAGNAGIVAVVEHQMGLVFEYQGRFGAAVKSIQDAVKSYRDQGEKGLNMAIFLNDLAGAFARAGRSEESSAPLDEAEKIQQSLKNDVIEAGILNTRGDIAFYAGDLKNAERFYASALRTASRTKEGEITLLSRINAAKVVVGQGQYQQGLRTLESLLNNSGVSANLTIQINLAIAEAAIGLKDYTRADHTLEQQLATAQRSGMRFELARIYYLLGKSARLNGSGVRASEYYQQAAQLLDTIDSDSGAENVLHRNDVKTIYDECNHWKK
jgi:tetratricopeptide (TPR) repeat protein/predicted Ser/Thr protein kinase